MDGAPSFFTVMATGQLESADVRAGSISRWQGASSAPCLSACRAMHHPHANIWAQEGVGPHPAPHYSADALPW